MALTLVELWVAYLVVPMVDGKVSVLASYLVESMVVEMAVAKVSQTVDLLVEMKDVNSVVWRAV